jgi:hypothetical protein
MLRPLGPDDDLVGEMLDDMVFDSKRLTNYTADNVRGVFLTAMGADEVQIEASFCAAIRIARAQKSLSMAKRAEASYAEYRRQKASASGEHGFRLPLC